VKFLFTNLKLLCFHFFPRFSLFEKSLFVFGIFLPTLLNFPIFPTSCKTNFVSGNEVMGFTFKTPVTNRRRKRYGFSVKTKLPICRRNWRYYFITTTADTFVNCCAIIDRNVQCHFFDYIRNEFNEFILYNHRVEVVPYLLQRLSYAHFLNLDKNHLAFSI
jgi:hypothetical protein